MLPIRGQSTFRALQRFQTYYFAASWRKTVLRSVLETELPVIMAVYSSAAAVEDTDGSEGCSWLWSVSRRAATPRLLPALPNTIYPTRAQEPAGESVRQKEGFVGGKKGRGGCVPAKDQLAVLVESPVAMVVYNQQRLVVSKAQKLLHYHGQSLDRRVHGDQALVDLIAIRRKRIVQACRLLLEAHDKVASDLVEPPGQVVEGPGEDENVGGFVFSLG